MTICKNCSNYKPDPTNPEVGYCYGHEVPGDMDAELCFKKAFSPRFMPDQGYLQASAKAGE